MPQVLTRGRQPVAGIDLPPSIDARSGKGLQAEVSATGWEVEATGSMNAEPPGAAPDIGGAHLGEDMAALPPPQSLPNGALPPPEEAPEPVPPPPPPPPRFELDKGPDAVMKLYEKLRAERLARDASKKGEE